MHTFKIARKYGAKIAAAGTALTLSTGAFAQSSSIDSILDAVTLTGIETKIVAACLLIVAITLALKGPDLAKRIIRKV